MATDREQTFASCRLHGLAYTPGCPGCAVVITEDDFIDDLVIAEKVRARTRWWRSYELCKRIVGHWERELEVGVTECRLCRCLTFGPEAADDALERWLLS